MTAVSPQTRTSCRARPAARTTFLLPRRLEQIRLRVGFPAPVTRTKSWARTPSIAASTFPRSTASWYCRVESGDRLPVGGGRGPGIAAKPRRGEQEGERQRGPCSAIEELSSDLLSGPGYRLKASASSSAWSFVIVAQFRAVHAVARRAPHGQRQRARVDALGAPEIGHALPEGEGFGRPALLRERLELRAVGGTIRDRNQKERRIDGGLLQRVDSPRRR